jgi:hypothetical protein
MWATLVPLLHYFVSDREAFYDYVSTDGTIINTYENLLAFTMKLGDSDPPSRASYGATNKDGEELAVFYDVLQMFYISYSGLDVINMHIAALLIGIFTLRHLSSHNYRLTISSRNLMGLIQSKIGDNQVFYVPLSMTKIRKMLLDELMCIVAPIIGGVVTGVFVTFLCPMRWYAGGVWVANLLYLPPCILSTLYIRGFVATRSHNDFAVRQIAAISLWVSLLALSMIYQVMSGYICCWWIVCSCCAALSYHAALKYYPIFPDYSHTYGDTRNLAKKQSMMGKVYTVLNYMTRPDNVYSIFMCPAICVWVQILRATVLMLLPLLGKSGTVLPGDLALGALFGILVGFTSGPTLANTVQKPLPARFFRRSVSVITCIVGILAVFTSPYSATRPKRMWQHHIERVRFDHGPHSTFPERAKLISPPSLPVATTTLNSRTLMEAAGGPAVHAHPPLHNHHHHLLKNKRQGNLRIVDDAKLNDTTVNLFSAKIVGLSGSTPTATNIRYNLLADAKVDQGLWIGGIDGLGMSPFAYSDIDVLRGKHAQYCDTNGGGCYFTFPWFFPVAVGVQGTQYIPTATKPEVPEHTRLNAEWSYTVLKEIDTPLTSQTQRSGNAASQPEVVRRVRVHVSGPDHMNIVIRDSALGSRVLRWYLNNPTHSNSKSATVATRPTPVDSTRPQVNNLLDDSALTLLMKHPSPVRIDDGIYLFQLEFGTCLDGQGPNFACSRTLWVDVLGEMPVDVAVYGHYIAISDSPELVALRSRLPKWAVGAEWTNFPSIIISGSI